MPRLMEVAWLDMIFSCHVSVPLWDCHWPEFSGVRLTGMAVANLYVCLFFSSFLAVLRSSELVCFGVV